MNNIKEVIKDSGLKQKAICDRLGITEGLLSHIINGRRKPNQEIIKNLARILNVAVVKLFPNAKQKHYWEI